MKGEIVIDCLEEIRGKKKTAIDCLEEIRGKYGVLTPEIVVNEARDPSHPLHDRFEWDNTVAGEKWRRKQAHDLIVSYRVTYHDRAGNMKDARYYHAIRRETSSAVLRETSHGALQENSYAYVPIHEVVRDEVATQILMADMEREWRQLKRRYEKFVEFREMVLRDFGQAAA